MNNTSFIQPKVPEEQIVANTLEDVLYNNDFGSGLGKYLNIYSSDEFIVSPEVKVKVTITHINEKDDIRGITIEKYKKEQNNWSKTDEKIVLSSITFEKLFSFIAFLKKLDLKGINARRIGLSDNSFMQLNDETKKMIVTLLNQEGGTSIIEELIRNEILTDKDIINTGYRKRQLSIFYKLLYEENYYQQYKLEEQINDNRKELIWQYFFEKNPWIFGYGLSYIFCSNIDDRKLEQVVSGFDFAESGKRVDALLKTYSEISKFVLVEIKLPEEKLTSSELRSDCWTISKSVADGLAQIQKTKEKFKKSYFESTEIKDENGYCTQGKIFSIFPKSYLVIGNLNCFKNESGFVNYEQYSSFELFRNNLYQPEIITYDELFHRAQFIIENTKL